MLESLLISKFKILKHQLRTCCTVQLLLHYLPNGSVFPHGQKIGRSNRIILDFHNPSYPSFCGSRSEVIFLTRTITFSNSKIHARLLGLFQLIYLQNAKQFSEGGSNTARNIAQPDTNYLRIVLLFQKQK